MIANCLNIGFIIYMWIIMVNSVTCGTHFESTKFEKIKQGGRVDEGSIAFAKSADSRHAGSCELLDYAKSSDDFGSSITSDSAYCIYRDATHKGISVATDATETSTVEITSTATAVTTPTTGITVITTTSATTVANPTTSAVKASTTVTTPSTAVTEDPNCAYANSPAAYSCNCSTSSIPCSGILQCSASYSNKSEYYYLDRSKAFATFDPAKDYCTSLKLQLIMVKTMEEQSTICSMLSSAVGTSVSENFWMGLRKDPGDAKYQYIDRDPFGSIDVWAEVSPNGCVYIAGAKDHFKWKSSKKCDGKELTGSTVRAICSKDI